ncbi:calcium transporting ATPase [Sistotremastrum niveocremeum HHB9708]|uniref:Phospholipid-transporting ATPase n=1 Tax=Sistotremastrum niveocremeum HHB9708 TaxID=1314777 RepID=A0A164PL08_9AGAM|nr:calcium transporting ATPase [Sistotremastrum niveocremeum HHB9708]
MDDFANLVSRANPAASQYQPAGLGYPPPTTTNGGLHSSNDPESHNIFLIDDDDDEPVQPDSAFRSAPMASVESGLPFAGRGAPAAGTSWEDTEMDQVDLPGPRGMSRPKKKRKMSWDLKWPWQKEKVREGDRVITLNDEVANYAEKYCSNYVSTSKYNPVTFVPKFLLEQFSKYANLFFLFTALIQQVPGVSPTNRYTTIAPLAVVLLASAFKEFQEDLKRHQSDAELNARHAKVLDSGGRFVQKRWKDIRVGDLIRVESDEFIPADLVLVASSEPEGLCYIETSNLDGETNLKIKQASPHTSKLTTPQSVLSLKGTLRCEQPNNSLYTFSGTITSPPTAPIPLGPDQLLLRGAQLRNTPWVYGLAIYTGHETKLMRNATSAPIKRTNVEKRVNTQIVFLFVALLALSLASSIGSVIRTWFFAGGQWYLSYTGGFGGKDILTFIILYNNLIPISLIVTLEIVRFQQSILINSDLDMYYEPSDTPALCRTSSLVEELGQIEYVFSDKTGTLTQNMMEFWGCCVGGVAYSEVVDESKVDEEEDPNSNGGNSRKWRTFKDLRTELESGRQSNNPFVDPQLVVSPANAARRVLEEFMTLLAVCHTVIPERKDDGSIKYQASSPDEAALVAGAEMLGYQFHTRKPRSVYVDVMGTTREYEILNVCEFNSTRKRMSTVVRAPDGTIKLFCKGADTVILERLSKEEQPYTERTLAQLEDYATEGLRTLCLASRDISAAEYSTWSSLYDKAAARISGRGDALDEVAELIEKDMSLLGATAVEDKLQEGVPDTIHTLQMAGIKVWVLTGDRQETAINIGMSCRLISESMNLVIVNEESAHETEQFLSKRLTAIKNQRKSGELEDLALVIDGKSLTFALEKEISKTFLELAIMCKAVICCRVSPLQKALVVKLVKKNQKAILLAIGDGANDVSMIQAAHVGVGISGVEGLQAARSADVAISQFRFLKKLLLVHGAWSYQRLSKLILYSFYKNIVLYMTQFWYSFFNNFSGQIAYESWTLSLYNVLFTVLPPLVIGVFDQFVSARLLDRYPQLYMLGQQNVFFTPKAFWMWVGNALYHSIVLFGFSIIMFWGDLKQATGFDTGHWFWGTTLYLAVLLTVLGKAALVSDLWTKYTVAAIPGSFVFTMVWLPLYALIAPAIGFSTEYSGIVPRLWTDGVFYFTILLLPFICLVRDFVWKYYRRTYMPLSYHIAQELQKYNIPDYRPRQEQFQKAIKKVRAVQRMRRNRGFAFSQTENGSRQDQARMIRAYDTSQAYARPSGY